MSAIETHCAATGLHRGSPRCVRDTYALLCRELTRKQGMVDDLKQIAEDNFGLSPEDCALLESAVRDRDAILQALDGIKTLFN